MTTKYAAVFEKSGSAYEAYAPDLPRCVAAATSLEEVEKLIREGIELHLDGMREDGDAIPSPTTIAEMIEITAA